MEIIRTANVIGNDMTTLKSRTTSRVNDNISTLNPETDVTIDNTIIPNMERRTQYDASDIINEKTNIFVGRGEYISGYENYAKTDQDNYLSDYWQKLLYTPTTDDINIPNRYLDEKYGTKKGEVAPITNTIIQDIYDSDYNIDTNTDIYDNTTGNFRYGLEYNKDNFLIDDPLLPAFEIELDGTSPLFKDVNTGNNTSENTLCKFLNDYKELYEIGNRIEIHKEFVNRLERIFRIPSLDTDTNTTGDMKYYINQVDGLENLKKKIIKYKDDKLSISLHENVSMFAYYLSELYNNLIYSYRNQRILIPEHLLRFNMKVSIKEMRNFVYPKKIVDGGTNSYPFNRSPISKIEIELYDCNFDFYESKIWEEHLIQAGLGAALPTNYSFLTFDIFYKSVKRKLVPNLIPASYTIDSMSKFSKEDTSKINENIKNNLKREEYKQPSYFSGSTLSNITNQINENINNTLASVSNSKLRSIIEFRNSNRRSLLKQLTDDILGDVLRLSGQTSILNNPMVTSLIEMTPLATYRKLIIDALNGNFESTKQAGLQWIKDTILQLKQKAFLELSNAVYNSEINEGDKTRIYLDDIRLDNLQENILGRGIRPPKGSGEYQDSDGVVYRESQNVKGYESTPPKGSGEYQDSDGVVYEEGEYEHKSPEGVVYIEPETENKLPDGVVYEEGEYEHKSPEGVVYIEPETENKLPDGVVYEEGEYEHKSPDGVVYIEPETENKLPDGVVYEEGEYEHKSPEGVVYIEPDYEHKIPKGTGEFQDIDGLIDNYKEIKIAKKTLDGETVYVEPETEHKLPDGVVYEEGEYEHKSPEGIVYVEPETENKLPDGVVYEEGEYEHKSPEGIVYVEPETENKLPDGVVYEEGEYEHKSPEGVVYIEPETENKLPDGVVYEEGEYEHKSPEGVVYIEPETENKLPDGVVYEEGEYEHKSPDGVVYEEGEYEHKSPEGVVYVEPETEHKLPDGVVYEEGEYEHKSPEGVVYTEPKYEHKSPEGVVYVEPEKILVPFLGEIPKKEKIDEIEIPKKYIKDTIQTGDIKDREPYYTEGDMEAIPLKLGILNEQTDKVILDEEHKEKEKIDLGRVYEEGKTESEIELPKKYVEDKDIDLVQNLIDREKIVIGPEEKIIEHYLGKVYEESGYTYKSPEGVVYEEGEYIHKSPDGIVYEEEKYIHKSPDGEVYVEKGPIYKSPDGEVYIEHGPIYKPPVGVDLYFEKGLIYKPPEGEVYEEGESIYKPPEGKVYEEGESIYKPPEGKVYEKDNKKDND